MLRHADVATTLGLYAHANSASKMTAQGAVLKAFFSDAEALYSYEGTREMNTLIVGRSITGFNAFV